MDFTDKKLKCVDCVQEFIFSAGEQLFFHEKQFQHLPKRCKACKAKRAKVRTCFEAVVVCSECEVHTTVPFQPRLGRPVLCRSCFERHRAPLPSGTTGNKEQLNQRRSIQELG